MSRAGGPSTRPQREDGRAHAWHDGPIDTDDEPTDDAATGAPHGTTADDAGSDEGTGGAFDRWRRASALGAMGTGVARGLQAVFAPPADEIVVVASLPGDPPGADDALHVILDPDDPTKAVAIVPDQADPPGS